MFTLEPVLVTNYSLKYTNHPGKTHLNKQHKTKPPLWKINTNPHHQRYKQQTKHTPKRQTTNHKQIH